MFDVHFLYVIITIISSVRAVIELDGIYISNGIIFHC